MTIKNSRFAFMLLALFVFAGTAAAQSATVPRVTMTATVETVLRLDISNGAGGVIGGGTSSDFTVNLGNVNGQGIAPITGVTALVTPGAGIAGYAIYTTPIVLTPVFSGYAGNATIALTVGGGANDAIAVEGDSNATATLAAARPVVTGSLSDVPHTRHVGFKISKMEAVGARTAMFLYTITMP